MNNNISNPTKNAKSSSIIGYFTLVGFIIAFFMNLEEKHPFTNFHLRQSLGLQTFFYAFGALVGLSNSQWAGYGFYICFFILWTFAVITTIQNKTEAIPLVGKIFQKAFNFLK